MRTTEGLVTIAQEGRFQLVDDDGVAHLFLLSHGSSAGSQQLAKLQKRQARVRVTFKDASNLIARVAHTVDLCVPVIERGNAA